MNLYIHAGIIVLEQAIVSKHVFRSTHKYMHAYR